MDFSRARVRERDDTHVVGWTYTSPTGVSTYTTSNKVWGSYERMWDFVTPGFHKKSSKGAVIMSPMSQLKDTQTVYTDQQYRVYHTSPPYATVAGPVPPYLTENGLDMGRISYPGNQVIDSARQRALNVEAATRCLSEIRRTSVDNWENIAEAGKTLTMLEKPVGSWLRYNRKFQLASAGLSAANAWLAYRYGARPLIKSIEGIVKESFRTVRHVRQTTRTAMQDQATSVSTSAYNGGGTHRTFQTTQVEKYEVRCVSLDEALSGMAHRSGLSAKSLLTLPWELIPYSFVVDWLANVGDFIGALAQATQPASLGQCETHTWDYTWTRVTTSAYVDPPLYGHPGAYSAKYAAILRARYPSLTSPGLTFKSDFRLLNPTRLTDSVALIGQQILRRFR